MSQQSLIKLRSRNGCLRCKRRKQKCDESRPQCDHCRRSRCECIWLDQLTAAERQSFERRRRQNTKIDLVIRHDDTNERISFLLHFMFTGANAPCTRTGGGALTVHTELQFAKDHRSLTYACLDAMATVYWASKQNPTLLAAGYKARGTSLALLAKEISTNLTGDVVAAVSLARLFEMMLPHSESQWLIHAQGLAKVCQAMGPAAFQPLEMRRLLENNRWVLIMAYSALRQPYILNTPEWVSVPWVGDNKDILQQLMDIYGRLPSLHHAWDTGAALGLQSILDDMHDWRVRADSEIKECVSSSGPYSGAACTHLHHAYALILFNTMIIVLSRYVIKSPVDVQAPVLSKASAFQEAAAAADEIASFVPWMLGKSRRGAGALYLAGPMHCCNQFWQASDPVKAEWSSRILKQIEARWSSLLILHLQLVQP